MNQRRGTQGLAGGFAVQLLGGQATQLVIDERQKLLGRKGIALLDSGQDARHFAHGSAEGNALRSQERLAG
jgi:hypothetical protein